MMITQFNQPLSQWMWTSWFLVPRRLLVFLWLQKGLPGNSWIWFRFRYQTSWSWNRRLPKLQRLWVSLAKASKRIWKSWIKIRIWACNTWSWFGNFSEHLSLWIVRHCLSEVLVFFRVLIKTLRKRLLFIELDQGESGFTVLLNSAGWIKILNSRYMCAPCYWWDHYLQFMNYRGGHRFFAHSFIRIILSLKDLSNLLA